MIRREKEMKNKKAKKTKGKKKVAVSKPKQKKIVLKEAGVLRGPEMKEGIPKIAAIVKDGLSAKLAYKEILKNVLKHHPESKFNKKHLSWYKNKLGVNKT
jgi:hypothetical protein